MGCPGGTLMFDFIDNALSPWRMEKIRKHLIACADCQRRRQAILEVKSIGREIAHHIAKSKNVSPS